MNDLAVAHLIERVGRGNDPEALAELFDETAPALYRLALRLTGNPTDAEDALQETFLAVLRRARSFDATRPPGPWLATVLAHEVDRLRARRGLRSIPLDVDPEAPEASSTPLEQREDWDRVRKGIDRLPERYRRVLLLRYEHGLTPAKIAEVLGIPDATARSLLHRGIERLKRVLGIASLALLPAPFLATSDVLNRVRARVVPEPSPAGHGFGSLFPGGRSIMKPLLLVSVGAAAIIGTTLIVTAKSEHAASKPPSRDVTHGPAIPNQAPLADAKGPSKGEEKASNPPGSPLGLSAGRVITGRVLDGAGQGIARAVVYLVRSDMPFRDPTPCPTTDDPSQHSTNPVAETDASGAFFILDPPAGTFDLGARVEDFAPSLVLDLQVPEGDCTLHCDVTLAHGDSIRGRVLDTLGHPVEGATVFTGEHAVSMVWWPQDTCRGVYESDRHLLPGRLGLDKPPMATTTAADGSFRLAGFPRSEPVPIAAWKDGYFTERGEASRKNAQPGSELTLTLAPFEPVRLVVLDADTGAPVPRYEVMAEVEPRAGSIPDGGAWTFVSAMEVPAYAEGDADAEGARLVPMPATGRNVRPGAQGGGYNFGYGEPFVLAPGNPSPPTAVVRLHRPSGQPSQHYALAQPILDVETPGGGTIDHLDLAFLNVDTASGRIMTSADRRADGSFGTTAIKPGRYRAIARDTGFNGVPQKPFSEPRGERIEEYARSRLGAYASEPVDVVGGARPTFRLVLQPLGAAAVNVRDTHGQSLVDVHVAVRGEPDIRWPIDFLIPVSDLGYAHTYNMLSSPGTAYAVALWPGRYTFDFTKPGFAPVSRTVDVAGGEVARVEVSLDQR